MSEDALFKTHSSNSLRDGLGESLQQQERESERAEMSEDRGQWPMWVRFGLWKVPSARAANAYRFFSGLIAVGAGIARLSIAQVLFGRGRHGCSGTLVLARRAVGRASRRLVMPPIQIEFQISMYPKVADRRCRQRNCSSIRAEKTKGNRRFPWSSEIKRVDVTGLEPVTPSV